MQQKRKRYPGVRPFEITDKDIFFGRSQEIQDLSVLLALEKLVVLFGKSGYGKSSLLNAGLIPFLQNHNDSDEPELIPLVIRLNSFIDKTSLSPIEKVIILVGEKMNPIEDVSFLLEYLPKDSLWYCFKRCTPFAPTEKKKIVRFILIFDQFEEFFTYPIAEQNAFKAQLADLLYSDMPQVLRKAAPLFNPEQRYFLAEALDIKVLFAIRADHMSYLDSLKDKLPAILHKRFEMKGLSEQQAREAIERPAQQLGDFASSSFGYSSDALEIMLQKLNESQHSKEQWRGVEAFQLQILCEYLEEEIIAGRILHNQIQPIHFHYKIDAIYEGYFHRLLDKLPPQIAKAAVRLIKESLIFNNENGESRRLSVDAEVLIQRHGYEGITDETLQILKNAFILRREPNSVGGFNYELSHDTLIRAILTTEKSYNITYSPGASLLIKQAKNSIIEGKAEQSLQILSKLNVSELDIELLTLNSRLVRHRLSSQQNLDHWDEKNRAYNSIIKDILDIIKTLEIDFARIVEYYQPIKLHLIKRYSNRLDQKLASRHPINLRFVRETIVTTKENDTSYISFNGEMIGKTMVQLFREARGRFLLVGAPGSGKTTLLLQLILGLLEQESDNLPVLLNLSTWSNKDTTIIAWLRKILPLEIGVSEDIALNIILKNRLILILDGFDEIKEDERVKCAKAIGRYGEDGQRQYVISSRQREYLEVAQDFTVESLIEVGPLSLKQLEAELQRLWSDPVKPERGARLLWNAIQSNESLQQVVQTPFYFNALQILFSGSNTWAELNIASDSVQAMQDQITTRFVQYELDGAREEYSPEKSSHWLSFLASRMNERNMVVFEIRDLQYDWWKWDLWKNIQASLIYGLVYGLSYGLVLCLALGLVFGLFIDLIGSILYTLVFSLTVGLILGLILCLINGLRNGIAAISTREIINWSWRNYALSILNNRKSILASALVVGLVFGLAVSVVEGVVAGLVSGLILGLIGGVVGGIVYLIHNSTNLIQITSPYQRFFASMKNLYFSILQHKHLCYLLRKKGVLPPDLVQFLNEMSRRHILEFDGDPETGTGGGSWRFRHRILQEYFAERWVEPDHGDKK